MTDLETAYENTEFEMVQQTEHLEIPVSTGATFEYENPSVVENSDQLKTAISDGEFALIAPFARDSPTGDAYLSSKVYAAETNEFLHVKLGSTTARIFPKDEEFSFETFEAIVSQLESSLGTSLIVRNDDDDENSE